MKKLLFPLILLTLLLTSCGGSTSTTEMETTVSVDEAFKMYQDGVFFLDVRQQDEWNDFHAPNSTLIPLDQLPNRLDEVPSGQPIVVVCRSGNRSQAGRDILLESGFSEVTSMSGGLTEWVASGYPSTNGP